METQKTEVLNKTEKPNSIQFRYSGTGSDVKIYFSDDKDLVEQLKNLNKSSEEVAKSITEIKTKMGGL